MKKNILLIFSILVCATTSVAQVREFQISAPNNSIIRSVDGEYVLFYTEDASGDGYFLLYRDGDPSAKAFPVYDGVRVRDVRIYDNKTAYFCGTYTTLDWGIVGKFDIFSTFNGTGNVDYGGCDWSITTYKIKPTDLKRLDLFDSAGVVGMAMVGDSKTFLGFVENGTTVASAWFDGTQWHMYAHLNKGNYFRFTDVACLEHSIVAVGTDSTGHGCLVKTFISTLSFPYYLYVYTPNVAQKIDFLSPVGDVLATRAGKDTVLIAHYDNAANVMTVLHRAKISPSSGTPAAPVDTWITDISSTTPYSYGWKMLELADSGHSAHLLQNAEFPATTGLGHRLTRIPMLTVPSSADHWLPRYGKQQSMDLDAVTLKPRLSGTIPELVTHAFAWPQETTACYSYAPMPAIPTTAAIVPADIDDESLLPDVHSHSEPPTIFSVPVELICHDSEVKEGTK